MSDLLRVRQLAAYIMLRHAVVLSVLPQNPHLETSHVFCVPILQGRTMQAALTELVSIK